MSEGGIEQQLVRGESLAICLGWHPHSPIPRNLRNGELPEDRSQNGERDGGEWGVLSRASTSPETAFMFSLQRNCEFFERMHFNVIEPLP